MLAYLKPELYALKPIHFDIFLTFKVCNQLLSVDDQFNDQKLYFYFFLAHENMKYQTQT